MVRCRSKEEVVMQNILQQSLEDRRKNPKPHTPTMKNLLKPDARELRAMAPKRDADKYWYNAALASAVHLPESELKEQILISRKKIREFTRDEIKRPRFFDPESNNRAIAIHKMAIRVSEAELKRRKQPRKRPRTFKARR